MSSRLTVRAPARQPSAAPTLPWLRVHGAVKRFGGVVALGGVDLELKDREVLGLIGPNGSGKSTLVNCISGVLAVTDGRVYLNGTDITRYSPVRRARAGIARTFQNLRLFEDMTVTENVLVGTSVRGKQDDRDHLDQLLTRMGLDDVRGTVVSDLPYGHRRRVELARALASKPSVLLLDEPAAGLNDSETLELLELVREIRDELGCGAILIDHDMSLVMKASDRVQVLDEGHVLYVGSPSEVFEQSAVVEAYLGADA